MKYIAILDSENKFTEEVIESLKDTGFLGDNPCYAFVIDNIQERKEGKWIGEEEGYYSECSFCGASFLWEDYKYIGDWKYCPKCGSKISDIPTGSD